MKIAFLSSRSIASFLEQEVTDCYTFMQCLSGIPHAKLKVLKGLGGANRQSFAIVVLRTTQ